MEHAPAPRFWKRLTGWLQPVMVGGPAASRTLPLTLERFTLLVATAVFSSGLIAALAATFGLFRAFAPLLWLLWLGVLLVAVLAFVRSRVRPVGDRYDAAALLLAVLTAASAGLLHHDFYSSQTDIGFYVSDAALIAATGGRILEGPHDATLPSFAPAPEGGYRVSAMFGYTAFAALFGYLGGPSWLGYANAPLAFTASLAIYHNGRFLGARTGAVLASLFYATCLIPLYMGRWVMTENAAVATFWVSTLLAVSLVRSWDPRRFYGLLVALAYGALVRAEGIAVAVWFLAVLAFAHRRLLVARLRAVALDPARRTRRNRVLAAYVFVILLAAGATLHLLRELPSDYLSSNFQIALQILRGRPAADAFDVPTTGPGPNWGDYALRYEWDSSTEYYLHWFLAVAALGLALGITPRRRALALVLLCVPYVLFVLIPPVTTAHPWFMRRLWIALIPLVFILAGAGLDLHRAGLRWPIRSAPRRTTRISAIFGALAIAVSLLLLSLDVTAPVLLKREQDGVQPLLPELLDALPEGAAVLLDEEAVGFTFFLRLEHGERVVPWFNQRMPSFRHSFLAADGATSVYILRLNSTDRNIGLDTDPQGRGASRTFDAVVERAARADFRQYLSRPPLAQGYRPLEIYLEEAVPPNAWTRQAVRFSLEEVRQPVVLQKSVRFAAGEWERTSDGMRAVQDNASLAIDRARFVPSLLETLSLSFAFAYPQLDALTRPLYGRSENGTVALGPLASDGSGTLRFEIVPLPMPMRLDAVLVPRGTVLRGIYFGPSE